MLEPKFSSLEQETAAALIPRYKQHNCSNIRICVEQGCAKSGFWFQNFRLTTLDERFGITVATSTVAISLQAITDGKKNVQGLAMLSK